MPIWDSIQAATDQQCLDFVTHNLASASASDETTFRNHSWAEVRELNGYLIGLTFDPIWPKNTVPSGFFVIASLQSFVLTS